MAGRLAELRVVDPVLTRLAWGYVPATWIGAVLFPIVPVSQEAGKVPKFGSEAFQIYNTLRPLRGKRARIDFSLSWIDYALEEHSIEVPLDEREIEDAELVFDARNAARATGQRVIFRRVEYNQAMQAVDANNYASTNKVSLSGTDLWTDYTNSDPIGDVRTGKAAIRGKIGVDPNVIVLGNAVYVALQDHTKILARIQYAQKGIITPDLLAEIFDIPKVVVGAAAYASEASAFTNIWDDDVVLAYVPSQQERDLGTPAYGYTFRKRGRPRVFRYADPESNCEIVVVEDILVAKVLSDVAGYLITNAV